MRRSIAVAFCILIVLASSAAAARAATITLRGETGVASAVVRLGDIADISGGQSQERLERLRSVVICSAPPPAETQILSAAATVSALRASGLDLSGLELAGHSQVIVKREYDLISIEELERIFSEHVSERMRWPRDSFIARAPKNLHPVPVPVGERAVAVETAPDEDFCGSVLARLQVIVDGRPYRTLVHRFDVERYVEALVAARKLSRGRPVGASDVAIEKIEQSLVDEDSLTSVEEAVGLLARRTIQPGSVLRADLLTLPPVVRRGEFKSVVCAGSGFQVLTMGRVLEDGAADEVVRVRLPSKKIVKAMVLDSKTLQMVRQGE